VTSHQKRELDIVVLGATGFTGALTAEYLAAQGPGTTRWAIAGRNRGKLEALRERLGVDVAILDADVGDAASLRRLAEASRVVVNTVGPYLRYGEGVVAACAEAGTDYADLTGEPEFVDRMYLRYQAAAERSGARLVHTSVPSGCQTFTERMSGWRRSCALICSGRCGETWILSARTSCGRSTPSTYWVRLVLVSSRAWRRNDVVSNQPRIIAPVMRIPALASKKTRSSVTERWSAQPPETPETA